MGDGAARHSAGPAGADERGADLESPEAVCAALLSREIEPADENSGGACVIGGALATAASGASLAAAIHQK